MLIIARSTEKRKNIVSYMSVRVRAIKQESLEMLRENREWLCRMQMRCEVGSWGCEVPKTMRIWSVPSLPPVGHGDILSSARGIRCRSPSYWWLQQIQLDFCIEGLGHSGHLSHLFTVVSYSYDSRYITYFFWLICLFHINVDKIVDKWAWHSRWFVSSFASG